MNATLALTGPAVADKSGFCRTILISVLAELTFAQRCTSLNGAFCSARADALWSFRTVWSGFVEKCSYTIEDGVLLVVQCIFRVTVIFLKN